MKPISIIIVFLILIIPNTGAQNLKKAFKAYKKGDFVKAETIFKSIVPKNSAVEYGFALLNFNKDYRYKVKQAYMHIKTTDSLMIRSTGDSFEESDAYFSKDKILKLKEEIYDSIMNLHNSGFSEMYDFIHKTYWMANIENEFRTRLVNRKTALEFNSMKEELTKSYSKDTYNKLYTLIRQSQDWDRISEATDFRDSIKAVNLKDQTGRKRFLKNDPNNTYAYIVRSDFIKNYAAYKTKRHIVIKTSNESDEFVDEVIKNSLLYYYERSDYEIANSIVKDKYYLCIKKKFDESFPKIPYYFSSVVKLKKEYPEAFLAKERSKTDNVYYTIFSKDKVYIGKELLPTDYQSIIFIGDHNEFDDSDHYGWFIKMSAKTFSNNILVPHTFAYDNFEKVAVERIATEFNTEIDISNRGFNYKAGGVLFVKSGKRPKYIKYPECLDINLLIKEMKSYFTNLSNKKRLKESYK